MRPSAVDHCSTAGSSSARSGHGTRTCVTLLIALALLAHPAAQRPSLTGAAAISNIYDAIFDARFTDVSALRSSACTTPSAAGSSRTAVPASRAVGIPPAEVCQLLDALALWWEIQLDPHDPSRDATFSARVDAAIANLTAWTEREPSRAESWFYLGGAYGARAQWRALRGGVISAARDGGRIKSALEQALLLDPTLVDATFGIGLYHYYADVVPAAARLFRWLLALPGGDRALGLREMLRAREDGQLLRDEADFQLHLIYLWYEKKPERSIELLRNLQRRHPFNPLFPQLIAEIHDGRQDYAASAHTWRELLGLATARQVAEPAMTETRARLGMATALDRLFETDLALDQLRAAISSKPPAPYGAAAQAQLQLGQGLDRLGQRAAALDAYRAAMAAVPSGDPLGTAERARAGLRHTPDGDTALAYRLSLEGWRALERGALGDAERALARSISLRPQDQVTRYRQARLIEARGQARTAIDLYESVMSHAATPPVVFAAAALDAARLYERQENRTRAMELYQRARSSFGADTRTRDAAEQALQRIVR